MFSQQSHHMNPSLVRQGRPALARKMNGQSKSKQFRLPRYRTGLGAGFTARRALGPHFTAVLERRRGVSKQPIQSAVNFVHGPIASRNK